MGREGIGTLKDKIHTIRDLRQLKSFLGLAYYYKRFVRGFLCIGVALFHLQQKDHVFVWIEERQKAFHTLRQALSAATVLVPPDSTLPFVLNTDASNIGVGAVLSQEGPDGEKVVAYLSKVFNKCERCYCVTRRELLAVVMAVRHFKYYLCGTPCTIRTDHVALE